MWAPLDVGCQVRTGRRRHPRYARPSPRTLVTRGPPGLVVDVNCVPQRRRDGLPMSIVDADVVRMLDTPAQVGGKSIWVSEQCVRHHQARRRSSWAPWHVRLLLRQLLETGRYRRSPPAWVPADIAVFDGYVELRDGEELVGLLQDRDDPRTFRAVTWFARACLGWDVLPDDAAPREGALRVELSGHCVERYQERVVGGGTLRAAREELMAVVHAGRLLPEVPTWCEEHGRGGRPAYWLIVDDWLVVPLQPTSRPAGDVFRAVTCLYRGMDADEHVRPQFAPLFAAKLRLHRESLLALAAGRPLRQAA